MYILPSNLMYIPSKIRELSRCLVLIGHWLTLSLRVRAELFLSQKCDMLHIQLYIICKNKILKCCLYHWFLYARLETGCIMWLGMVGGGRPHRFPHDNFSSVYWIFTKLGHMIPLRKGKNPIYFGVIRSKVNVAVTMNNIVDNRNVSAR